jgi:hypothetical protein
MGCIRQWGFHFPPVPARRRHVKILLYSLTLGGNRHVFSFSRAFLMDFPPLAFVMPFFLRIFSANQGKKGLQ